MDNLKGNTNLSITSFPEFEDYPDRGKTNYRDSVVKEFELSDGVFSYVVKALVEIWYERWYKEDSMTGPEEDEILDHQIAVETISGKRIHITSELEMKLAEIELAQLEIYLQNNVTIEI